VKPAEDDLNSQDVEFFQSRGPNASMAGTRYLFVEDNLNFDAE
jgi:hypothetical protein